MSESKAENYALSYASFLTGELEDVSSETAKSFKAFRAETDLATSLLLHSFKLLISYCLCSYSPKHWL